MEFANILVLVISNFWFFFCLQNWDGKCVYFQQDRFYGNVRFLLVKNQIDSMYNVQLSCREEICFFFKIK